MKQSKLSTFLCGILKENPVLVLILGTCPTIAKSDTVFNAIGLGCCTAIVLILSNMAISALRNFIPDKVRIPCYILLIAGFVTIIQMLVQAFLPELHDSLGAFIALIVVNCIILGRAEMFASKNGVVDSLLDGAGKGVGFIAALFAMGTIREVLGAGTFFKLPVPLFATYHFPVLQKTFGGFLIYGVLIAVVQALTANQYPKKKEFDCASCPNAPFCSGAKTEVGCGTKEVEQ